MASPTTWNDYEVERHNMFLVDPRAILFDDEENLSRFGEKLEVDDELIALAMSMRPRSEADDENQGSVGQLQPILVRNVDKGRYQVAIGNRRLKAAIWLIESGTCPDFKIKCVTTKMNRAEAALCNVAENLHRLQPKPVQIAHAIRRLHEDMGFSIAKIAHQFNQNVSWCYRHLDLLSLPDPIRQSVDSGEIAVSTALELTKVGDEEAQVEVFESLREEGGPVTADSVREERRERGASVRRGIKQLKDFLKKMSQEGEVASNMAALLLDYLDGTVNDDEVERLWNEYGLLFVNMDMDSLKEAMA